MPLRLPQPLPHSSAVLLEFDPLRHLLRGYAASPLGQARVQALVPSADATWIASQQQLTAEVREFLRAGSNFDFSGLFDPQALLEKARIQGVALELAELRDLLKLIDRAGAWRQVAVQPPSSMRSGWPAVSALSNDIADFSELVCFFHNKITPDGALDDRASPELARLRREIEKHKRVIQESLRAQMRRLAESGAAQEELISIRGERFVIPVKTEHKRRVPGVVHGASSSGQTVYLEPLETIEQNNELVRLIEEELAETRRIFLAMTREIGVQSHAIAQGAAILAQVDALQARGRFAAEFECVRPRFADTAAPVLALTQARHPLLEKRLRARQAAIVPLTLELNDAQRQLIISGPNTGGKTLALKTAGLLGMMAQAGIPV